MSMLRTQIMIPTSALSMRERARRGRTVQVDPTPTPSHSNLNYFWCERVWIFHPTKPKTQTKTKIKTKYKNQNKKQKLNKTKQTNKQISKVHETWSLFCVGQVSVGRGPTLECDGYAQRYSIEEKYFSFSQKVGISCKQLPDQGQDFASSSPTRCCYFCLWYTNATQLKI